MESNLKNDYQQFKVRAASGPSFVKTSKPVKNAQPPKETKEDNKKVPQSKSTTSTSFVKTSKPVKNAQPPKETKEGNTSNTFVKTSKPVKSAQPPKETRVDNKEVLQSKTKQSKQSKINAFNYKEMKPEMNHPFTILTKILQHMRKRFMDGFDNPLTLPEILEEIHKYNVAESTKNWLENEGLPNNPKIQTLPDKNHFLYKPPYNIKSGKELVCLLKKHSLENLGGIFLEEIEESLPNTEKILKKYARNITTITRPGDEKKVLFYNDISMEIKVDEKIKNAWHAVRVDNMTGRQIEQFLETNGITAMQGDRVTRTFKRPIASTRGARRPRQKSKVKDLLELSELPGSSE